MNRPRTPQDLAKEALAGAGDARTTVAALQAVTLAIVALAGEVHVLTERVLESRTELKVDRLVVGEMDV